MAEYPFRFTFRGNAALDRDDAFAVFQRMGSRYDQTAYNNEEALPVGTDESEAVRYIAIRTDPKTFQRANGRSNHQIVRRALEEARAEGTAWTPLLDALADEDVWPVLNFDTEATYQNADFLDPDLWLSRHLSPWIRNAAPEEIDLLFRFDAEPIRYAVASYGASLTEAQVTTLLRENDRTALALTQNEAAMAQYCDVIVRHFFHFSHTDGGKAFLRTVASQRGLPTDVLQHIVQTARKDYGWKRRWGRDQVSREVWESDNRVALALEDIHLAGEDLQAVADAAPHYARAGSLCDHNADAALWSHVIEHPDQSEAARQKLLMTLADRSDIPAGLIDYLLDRPTRLTITLLVSFVKQERAGVPQLRRIAIEHPEDIVLVWLAARADARNDHAVREKLTTSRLALVAKAFIPHATAEEFPAVFRTLARHDPKAAAKALEEKPDGTVLEPTDLTPLLEADSETRLCAIQLLGKIRSAEASREVEEEARAPRLRR